jgi:sortase A
MRKLLLYFGCVLIVGGALALAWYGYLQLDMLRVQRAASRVINEQKKQNVESLHMPSIPQALVLLPPRPGEPLGRIEVPRLRLTAMVLEGTAPKTLRVAAGHIGGTALPGAKGNVGIAAHRDTLFRPLRGIRPKDDIVLTTSYGTFRYLVNSVEIVDPSDIQVLHPTTDPELTLVTCYPFTYIGSAPKRFIVHARQQA